MFKQVYDIDSEGFLKNIYVAEVEDGVILDDDKKHMLVTDIPSGFIRYKWNGFEWVEGESEAERTEREAKEAQQPPPPPTQEERIKMLEDTINFLLEL